MTMPRNIKVWLCLAAGLWVALSIVPAIGGMPDYRHVVPLRPGRQPFKGTLAYRNSWLGSDSQNDSGYGVLYSFEVIPGNDYTLGFSRPALARNVTVSLFSKWPYASGARRYTLPMGPALHSGLKISRFRWHLGIARESVDTLLYVAVEAPSQELIRRKFPHSIFLDAHQSRSTTGMQRGITYLQGPADFLLVGSQQPIAYVVQEEEKAAAGIETTPLPIPGDLVQNSFFTNGLNHWQPHREYRENQAVTTFALQTQGVRLGSLEPSAVEGIMQRIEKDVGDARALYLRADIKVVRQTLGGTGTDGRTAPLAIAICYQDRNGEKHCGKDNFWRGFYMLEPAQGQQSANGQKVPENLWYRYIFDMMQLDPKPGYIYSIALEGSGWARREAWVKNIHLIKKGTVQ
jgi:hypothetical protein